MKQTKSRLLEIENSIDEYFKSIPIPGLTIQESHKYLGHVSDDKIRFSFIGISRKPLDEINTYGPAIAFEVVDTMKYALRLCLNKGYSLPSADFFDSHMVLDKEQTSIASEALDKASDYSKVCRIFALIHEGLLEYKISDNNQTIYLEPKEVSFSFSSLEVLASAYEKKRHSGNNDFFNWIYNNYLPPFLSYELSKAKISKGRIKLHYCTFTLKILAEEQSYEGSLIPLSWKFPWKASVKSTREFIVALNALMLYHVSLVHFGTYEKVEGYGVNDICMIVGKKKLSRILSSVSGINDKEALEIIAFLTLGAHTTTPDPALQPIIELEREVLMLSPFLTLNNDFERNLLSLNARIDPKGFDSQSNIFEKIMTTKLKDIIEGTDFTFFPSTTTNSKNGINEEIDSIVIDEKNSTILILELRWMLQPGDAREVINRKKACHEKVKQLKRKLLHVEHNLKEVFSKCGIESHDTKRNWSIHGIVLVDGYSGVLSSEPNIAPILPLNVLEKSINSFNNLDLYCHWIKGHKWLPQREIHYNMVETELSFGNISIKSQIGNLLISPKNYEAYLSEEIQLCHERKS